MLLYYVLFILLLNLIFILDNVFVYLKIRWGVKIGGMLDLFGIDQVLCLNIVIKYDEFGLMYW